MLIAIKPCATVPPLLDLGQTRNKLAKFLIQKYMEQGSMFVTKTWCLCRCAQLIKQHALSPLAVPAGLGPTVQCCMLAMLYCTALETSHSLMLSPRLMRDLWPTCEQVGTLMLTSFFTPFIQSGPADQDQVSAGILTEASSCLLICLVYLVRDAQEQSLEQIKRVLVHRPYARGRTLTPNQYQT